MATRVLTRSRLTCTKQTLDSIFTRSFSSLPLAKPPQTALSPTPSLLWLRPVLAVPAGLRNVSPPVGSARGFATRQTTSSLNDPNPNWSNRPPKETILLDGCDFEHWLVVVEKPDDNMTRDQVIDGYIKLLAQVVGSEEEARMKIYSVSTKHYFAFGALVSEELSYKIKELPGVRWVLPDSYLDVKNKDYGGEPFINGQAVPYDPKYHEEWVRNNERSKERGNRNKPRNRDSRTYERRREMDMHRQNVQNTGGMTFPGGPQNMGPNKPGYAPPNSMGGGVLANNMGGMTPNNSPNHQYGNTPYSRGAPYLSGPQPNQSSYAPNTSSGNPQSSNMTGMPNNAQYGGAPHQSGAWPNQNSSVPNVGGGTGNPYQNQNLLGRDIPPPQNY